MKLTVRNYFSQRLLDADSRFAKDIEYLLRAQQLKATKGYEGIVLPQTQGRLHKCNSVCHPPKERYRTTAMMLTGFRRITKLITIFSESDSAFCHVLHSLNSTAK